MTAAISAFACLLFAASPLAAQDYAPKHLDFTGSASLGVAFAASRTGDLAVGLAVPNGGEQQPALWAGAGTEFLPLLAGDELGAAYGVSDEGFVVGESVDVVQQGQLTFFFSRGTLWAGGSAVELASLATSGAVDIEPFAGFAINHRGQILGWGKRRDVAGLRGFVLEDGVVTDLGSLQGTLTGSTSPADMNEQGAVVGSSVAPSFFDHAFVWQDGAISDLHALSGVPGRNSHAAAINEAGLIVGDADPTPDFLDYQNAAVWQDGALTLLSDLGDVGGVIESFARDVNDHGTIVGTSVTPSFEVHAVIWRDGIGGPVTDLNALIPPGSDWILANAHAISNDGRIFGEGFTPGGLKPFVLVPDCGGGFDVYGAGCAGAEGFVPSLWGQGCAEAGGAISLAVTNGVGGMPGLFFVGQGSLALDLGGCLLQILPLAFSVPITLGGAPLEPGAGGLVLPLTLPAALPSLTLNLQAVLADPSLPQGFRLTNALEMSAR